MSFIQKILLFFAVIPAIVSAQSISGNMNSKNLALGYGNVTIYKGDKRVASLITDAYGNFNMKLDTGYYKVEVKYVGHEPVVKNIHVTGDEVENFDLVKSDLHETPAHTEIVRSSRAYASETMAYSADAEHIAGGLGKVTYMSKRSGTELTQNEITAKPGQLTAGEVNDFSKWEMWQDIVENELTTYRKDWDLFLTRRYTVQIINQSGNPVVNARVELNDHKGKTRFTSYTDNTGKAELWGSLSANDEWSGKARAMVYFENKKYEIKHLTPFKEGVNTLQINASCANSDVVDIAFVVDATGSMQDEIDYLKAELNSVIFRTQNDFPELNFRFGNLFYRDYGDEYLTRRQDFTDVLSSAVDFISRQKAAGGGDTEEAVEVALHEAIDSLSWTTDSRTKILFLILDAPPHNTGEIREDLKNIIHKAAAKGIRIVPLTASGIFKTTEFLMRSLALGTNGSYLFLTNHSYIGESHIEPTTDTYQIELLNDLLIRIIKTYSFIPPCQDVETAIDDLPTPVENSQNSVSLDVWPNPTQGEATIRIDQNIEEIYITDLTGKIIIRLIEIHENQPVSINLSPFAKGIYLISFKHSGKLHSKKIIRI